MPDHHADPVDPGVDEPPVSPAPPGGITSIPRPAVGWRALETAAGVSWRLILIAVALWLAAQVVQRVWLVVLPVIAAFILTVAVWPVKSWLVRRRFPALLATWVAFLLPLVVVAGVVAVTYSSASSQFDDLGTAIDEGVADVRTWAEGPPLNLDREQVDSIAEGIGSQLGRLVEGPRVRTYTRTILEVLAGLGLALVVSFFFVKDGSRLRAWGLARVPSHRRDEADRMATAAWRAVRGYLRGTLLIGIVEGVLVFALLAIVRVPVAVPVALLTVLAAFFPLVGAVVAGTIAVLATLTTAGTTQALVVAIAVVVLQQIDGDVLQPLLMSGSVQLHPIVILLSLAAGGVVGGIAGAFLAVPTTAVVVAMAREWSRSRRREAGGSPAEPLR